MPLCGLGRVSDPSSSRRATCETVIVLSSQFHGSVVEMNGWYAAPYFRFRVPMPLRNAVIPALPASSPSHKSQMRNRSPSVAH